MLGDAQTTPISPHTVDRGLRCLVEDRRHRTAARGHINTVQTVKAQRSPQITGPYKVALMYLIRFLSQQFWIRSALGFIAASATMRQSFPTKNPTNGSRTG